MDLEAIVQRIDERLAVVGKSAAEASREAGLSADAIRNMKRALRTKSHTGASIKTLSALAPVLATTTSYLLSESDDEQVVGPIALPAGRVPYGGKVRAGEFLAVDEYFNQDEYAENVPPSVTKHPDFLGIPQFAWLAQGDSMSEVSIGEGTWIVAAPYPDYRDRIGELFNGQYVIVERTRHGGSERELTVKEVQFSRGGMRLIPRSSNPRHKEFFIPLDVDRDPDAEQITVLAVVLAAVRDLARPK